MIKPNPSPLFLHPNLPRLALWIGLIFLMGVFIFSSLAAAPLPQGITQTSTPQPLQITTPLPSALPAEYYETEEQSTAILLGAVVLVLIVSFSAMSVLFKRKPRLKK